MVSIIKDIQLECANHHCKKVFAPNLETHAILEVHLSDAIRTYHYCTKRHLEQVLENLNSKITNPIEKVEIKHQQVISEKFPFKIIVYLKMVEVKAEIGIL